jgi:hypothetical protein
MATAGLRLLQEGVADNLLYRGGQFYWWRKLEYPEKTTLSHNVVSSTPRHEWDSNSQP